MDALDPISLAGAVVAVAVVVSGFLFLLFSTREESFESSQAAQRVEQEALLLSKHSSTKVQKQKKKQGKGKKKPVEHDSEGEPAESEKEDIKHVVDALKVNIKEPVNEQEQKNAKEKKDVAKEEKPKPVAKEKEVKKKGKKVIHKNDFDFPEEQHRSRGGQSRKDKDETITEEVLQQVESQVTETIPEAVVVNEEILMAENQSVVSSEPPQQGKKNKNKLKVSNEKSANAVPGRQRVIDINECSLFHFT